MKITALLFGAAFAALMTTPAFAGNLINAHCGETPTINAGTYTGEYVGAFAGGMMDAELAIVDDSDPENVTVVYANGAVSDWNVDAGCGVYKAEIEDGVLKFKSKNGRKFEAKLAAIDGGKLAIAGTKRGRTTNGTLAVPLTVLATLGE